MILPTLEACFKLLLQILLNIQNFKSQFCLCKQEITKVRGGGRLQTFYSWSWTTGHCGIVVNLVWYVHHVPNMLL